MILSTLIKKGGLAKFATATPATVATLEAENAVTVATVATVAVAEKPEPVTKLSLDEESRIRAWLTHIEESDPAIIDEILEMCRTEIKHREYFLKRSEEVTGSGNRQ